MSYNHRKRAQGPWRDRYYYQNDARYNYNQSSDETTYGYGYGYDTRQYHAPYSSQSDDYYVRNTYEDTSHARYQYSYPAAPEDERQVHKYARYNDYDSYRGDQGPSTSRGNWDSYTRSGMTEHIDPGPVPYNHARDDRPVTPPPPRSPSPTYLKLADETPRRLSSPDTERKLLILDLNGTLVHRATAMRPKNRAAPAALDDKGRPLPRLRPVHPRPYMTTFRSYLFAPETRAWLDVMVWSSAQPHSVEDMVAKCFALDKERLLAVWARDTLGLTQDHYHRKVQTVKDLNTPWSKLSSMAQSRLTSTLDGGGPSYASPSARHSALTTLLLDDSPRKAELQPYNHFCVPEYSAEMRAKDLEILKLERSMADNGHEVNDQFDMSHDPKKLDWKVDVKDDADADTTRERRRKEKKEARRIKAVSAASELQDKAYDETLLAVIGVLSEIKPQRNVAAWIRAGGLWGNGICPESDTSVSVQAGLEQPCLTPASSIISHSSSPASRFRSSDRETGSAEVNADQMTKGSMDRGSRQAPRKERKSLRRQSQAGADNVEENRAYSPPAGNDAVFTSDTQRTAEGGVGSGPADPFASMWFEHPPTMRLWVDRGKKALEKLRIPIEHGIER
ncbi:hypothetical protein BC835DRAFT_1413355 [Cytidiella melzeri]|nr:hypothetical protein BC835DRAFT_1413355 [Cytidiella melzeri]